MTDRRRAPRRGERLVIISPHLDDAVLSLGATLAHLSQLGVHVEVLTVFGGDPEADRDPGASNRRAGFATTGEAARSRRHEDDVACAVLGVRPVRLPFDDDEASLRDGEVIGAALVPALRGADVVLVPGSPLVHPDHLLAAGVASASVTVPTAVGRYLEQPYAAWLALSRRGVRPWATAVQGAPSAVDGDDELAWERSPGCLRCRARKLDAAAAYRSQLRVLRRWPRLRIGVHELLARGERLAWPAVADASA